MNITYAMQQCYLLSIQTKSWKTYACYYDVKKHTTEEYKYE